MANDQEQINSELNKLNGELESLLAKQAESINQQKKYEEDMKREHNFSNVKELSYLIEQQKIEQKESSEYSDEEDEELTQAKKISYEQIKIEYEKRITEFENQQTVLAKEILETKEKHKIFQQQFEELSKKQNPQETQAEQNDSRNVDRVEVSSSPPVKTRISINQIQAVRDCLGKEFEWNTDQDSILLINTTSKHPTGYKITDEKMTAVNKQPLDAQACEKMLEAGVKLYGNKLVVYAPTEEEKKHMEEAAKKLNIECTVTTSKEEHQRLMDEHAKKMEAPISKSKPVSQPQTPANIKEPVNQKKIDAPIQKTDADEPLEKSQASNNNDDDSDLERTDSSELGYRSNFS